MFTCNVVVGHEDGVVRVVQIIFQQAVKFCRFLETMSVLKLLVFALCYKRGVVSREEAMRVD